MRLSLRRFNSPRIALSVVVAVISLSNIAPVRAQSRDANFPTPVFTNEISGRIQPRDLGDARLTRHFYTFNGTEGDLVITVESTDLDGDVDLFTADSLRPLTKITLYAGASGTKATKSVYLRQEEPLVLRVEGRTTGEAEAVYRIRFEGAFTASNRQPSENPETPTLAEPTARNPNSRRVTSVGARIDEPPTETAEVRPEPEPTPAATPETASTPSSARRGTRRNTTRRNPPRPSTSTRTRQTPAPADTAETTDADNSRATETPTESADATAARRANRSRTRPPRRSSARREQPAERASTDVPPDDAAADSSSTTVPAQPSPRLIIVTRDGETFERDMNTVHRVTVQNNQVVVVGKDGKVTRRPLADVLRMSIEP